MFETELEGCATALKLIYWMLTWNSLDNDLYDALY